ncbi:MAG: hypothetical protein V1860_00030 [bacterium]
MGEQETFDNDTLDSSFIFQRLYSLCENVIGRLVEMGKSQSKSMILSRKYCGARVQDDALKFKTDVITVRFSDFQTKTRSHTLEKPTADLKILKLEVIKLFLPFLDKRMNPRKKLIRLAGIRVEKLGY